MLTLSPPPSLIAWRSSELSDHSLSFAFATVAAPGDPHEKSRLGNEHELLPHLPMAAATVAREIKTAHSCDHG